MRCKTLQVAILTAAVAALAMAPTAHAVRSNGKSVKVKVACTGTAGTTTPGGAQGIYSGPYGGPSNSGGSGGSGGSGCNGSLILKKGKKKAGSGVFSLTAGQTKPVKVRLKGATRRAIKAGRTVKVKVTVKTSAALRAPAKLKITPARKKSKK